MIECAFACQTNRGTLCNYLNAPCYGDDGWSCGIMLEAITKFEELLNNDREEDDSEKFMENTIRKYGK